MPFHKARISMKMGLGLFFLIALASILGSLIPQGRPAAYYEETYGQNLGDAILLGGLDHVYEAWWFGGLGLVLALILCYWLICHWPMVQTSKGLGAFLAHLAPILILLGAGLYGLGGGQEEVSLRVGDKVHLQDGRLEGYALELEGLSFSYIDQGELGMVTSDLAITSPNKITFHQTLGEGRPYKKGGISVHQKDSHWEMRLLYEDEEGRRTEILRTDEMEDFPGDLPSGFKILALPADLALGKKLPTLAQEDGAPTLLVADDKGDKRGLLAPGESYSFAQGRVTYGGFAVETSYLLREDKGIALVYVGFALLVLGLVIHLLLNFYGRREK